MMLNLPDLINKHNLQITGVLHVGGHTGEEYDVYKNISTIKNIVFFEPDTDSFKLLKEKVKHDQNVICVNKALGSFSCTASLFKETSNNGQSNSILEPYKHTKLYPYIKFESKETVKIEPLDKFVPNKTLNFLNIDVQGFELNVLLGATNTLKNNIDCLVVEINKDELYKNCAFVEDIDYFLGKYGFERVETVWDRDSQVWGDAFYIKKT